MKTSQAPAWRTRPVAFLAKPRDIDAGAAPTASLIEGFPPNPLPDELPARSGRDQLTADHLVGLEHDQRTPKHALAVLATRVEADAPPHLGHSPRLVHVAVRTQQRLVTLDDAPHCVTSNRRHHRMAGTAHNLQLAALLTQLGRHVEPAVGRRYMEGEDARLRAAHGADQLLQPALELLLGQLARGGEGSQVRVAHTEQLVAAEVDDAEVGVLDHLAGGEDGLDAGLAIVARVSDEADVGARQPLVGDRDPALD